MAITRRIGRTELQKRFSENFTGHDGGFDDYTVLYESDFARAGVQGYGILRFTSGAASSDSDGDA